MTSAGTPLLSVVIPTHKRPQYLPRAIDSALLAAPDRHVEVLVVPNGLDESWKAVAETYTTERRVQWHPVAEGHANVARNHGMQLAGGKYIRFLDDDDYLLPAATEQIALLESTGAEICSGRVENIDEDGTSHGLLSFPDTNDFVCAALSFSGFALPTGHVFLRARLENSTWDVALRRRQDYAWMLDLASGGEWEWNHLDKCVGSWFQHRGVRISHENFMQEREQPVVDKLFALHRELARTARLSPGRNYAVSCALWHHAHLGFPYHPKYWAGVARNAQAICAAARPPDRIFEMPLLRSIDPVVGEWVLLPVRKAIGATRSIMAAKRDAGYKRKL